MSNVVEINGGKLEADVVLEEMKGEIVDVLVIGWDTEGCMQIAGNMERGSEIMWLIETAKASIMARYIDATSEGLL